MEKKVMQAFLYDFYGELLTQHQRTIYEDFVLHDLSLGEIAEEYGISRQGVHDLIKRCDRMLEGYEQKLHLFARFQRAKKKIEQLNELTKEIKERNVIKHNKKQCNDVMYCMEEAVIEKFGQLLAEISEEL